MMFVSYRTRDWDAVWRAGIAYEGAVADKEASPLGQMRLIQTSSKERMYARSI